MIPNLLRRDLLSRFDHEFRSQNLSALHSILDAMRLLGEASIPDRQSQIESLLAQLQAQRDQASGGCPDYISGNLRISRKMSLPLGKWKTPPDQYKRLISKIDALLSDAEKQNTSLIQEEYDSLEKKSARTNAAGWNRQ
jgi:hypothetical protein